MYNETEFNKLGLEFPSTTDELLKVLRAFKVEYPDSVLWTHKWGWPGSATMGLHPDAQHSTRDYGLGGYAGFFPEFLAMNVRNRPMLTAKDDFDHLPAVGFVYGGFTPEEIDAKVDLETLMQDTFKEHTLKFVIGQKDINSDAEWAAYVAALQKAGLAEYERVYQAAWNRAPFF